MNSDVPTVKAMRRISVVGTSGAGKSTFARALAQKLNAPHIELDAIFHQPNWTGLEDDVFIREVTGATQGATWVVDGNYGTVTSRGPVWERADTVIWIDPPDSAVMAQVIIRTLQRTIGHIELWNGNRESFRNVFRVDPHQSIIAWAWATRKGNRQRYFDATLDPRWNHLQFIRLTSRNEARRLLNRIERASD